MIRLSTVAEVVLQVLAVVPQTVGVALCILLLAIALGYGIALARRSRMKPLSWAARLYVSYFRGTPLLVHLLLVQAILPGTVASVGAVLGLRIDPDDVPALPSILVAFSFTLAAFQSETIRGALETVTQGQREAGWSIGMTSAQVFRRIELPQALRTALPSFCNGFIGSIKSMSLAFMVGFVDILARAKLASALNFQYIESYLAAALVYWVLCLTLSALVARLEAGLRRSQRGKLARLRKG